MANEIVKLFIHDSVYGGDSNLMCPMCKCEYTHICNAKIEGQSVVIVVEGECSHRWELQLKQHKGVTLVEWQDITPLPAWVNPERVSS